jgi:phosphatidylserine decarboxylase
VQGRRNPFVAQEGLPFLIITAVAAAAVVRYANPAWAVFPLALFVVLVFVFRDPKRPIPSSPRGVVSPVDGLVVEVTRVEGGVLQGSAHRILLRISALGTYTARCPVEGKIMDLRALNGDKAADYRTNALWVQTDEGVDVVLQFSGYRLGLAPRSFVRFGERLGQGQRCAYLRLTRFAEVLLPTDSKVKVEAGQTVVGGSDLLAKVTH